MNWQRRSLVYAPAGDRSWARTHALLPTPYLLNDAVVRVYFASLDEHNFGRVGFVDLDTADPKRILRIASEPVLDLGELGTFDDCGVVPSCIVPVDGKLFLYYVGFQRAERVPYMLFSGLAVGEPSGERFERHARTPVLDRTDDEPFSRGAPYILWEDGSFKMWYWSCTHWSEGPRGIHYNNVIRHATSPDGITWTAHPAPCLEPEGEDEYALGRPCVRRDGTIYRMWYSSRSHSDPYRMGYAESDDGIRWRRFDRLAGITKSPTGWDSEMVCYPMVMDFGGERHMFYNGNRCGATGFGHAVLER
jgi:hypothetical protein